MNAEKMGSTIKSACASCGSSITSFFANARQSALGSAVASIASGLFPQAGSPVVSQPMVRNVKFVPHISERKAATVLSSPEKKANLDEVSRDTPLRSPIRTTGNAESRLKGALPMQEIPENLEVAVPNSRGSLTGEGAIDHSPRLPNRR